MDKFKAKKEDIAKKLADYIIENGMKESSLRQLASRIGTSDRMLIHYFKDKETLMTTIFNIVIIKLINVLKGEMSLIGPRPEREVFIKDLAPVVPFYRFRHLVKPGITGLAQVMYRYGASAEDARYKHRYDLYYIRHRSWLLDLKILLKTVRVAFTGEGI